MIPAIVRVKSHRDGDVLAFVQLAGSSPEVRVRTRDGRWICESCGANPLPRCAHARAVVNSNAYKYPMEVSA